MSPFMSLFITSFVRIVQRNRENYIDRIVWRERERREREEREGEGEGEGEREGEIRGRDKGYLA